jgi:hypothetical protein
MLSNVFPWNSCRPDIKWLCNPCAGESRRVRERLGIPSPKMAGINQKSGPKRKPPKQKESQTLQKEVDDRNVETGMEKRSLKETHRVKDTPEPKTRSQSAQLRKLEAQKTQPVSDSKEKSTNLLANRLDAKGM